MRVGLTILGITGGVVLLVLLGVAIAVWTVDPNQFIGPVQARIKAATGRDVAIGGGIELKLGLEPKLVARDVRFGNAPWAKGPDMISAQSVEAQVALLPLLKRQFDLVRLNLVDPVIALETNAQGQGNWELAPPTGAPGAAKSGASTQMFAIGDLAITRGALTYRDGASGSETRVVIDTLTLQARDAQSPVNAEFRGSIDGIAVALTGNLGPLATLAQHKLPYPVAVQGEIAGRKASIALKVQRSEGAVELQDIEASSGASKVRGKVGIREAGTQNAYAVDLSSETLAVNDIALPVASPAPPKHAAAPASKPHYMFPDTPLPFDSLRKASASGEVKIGRLLLADGRALDSVRIQFALRDGKLDVPVLQFAGYGGTFAGKIAVDTTRPQGGPAVTLALGGHQLDVAALLAAAGVKRELRGGRTEIAIDVAMRGDSPHKWMSSASGRAQAVIGPATLVNAKLDPGLSFDQIAQLVNPFRATQQSTELHCAVARLPLASGIAHVDRSIAVETNELEVSASGTLDFRNETLDLSIKPRVRQGIPINIPQIAELVRFHGPFTSPTVGVDAMASAATVARIGAAVGTGGLSAIGETLLGSAAAARDGGGGACAVALGKATPASASSTQGKAPAASNPVQDLGSAVGKLLGR
ncbi:MAG TPA: AsmA family protein [Casimicrobiaceae bacterium]|nr:AsmA family protein [Casimicrobiaceae bacterium]